MKEKPVEGNIRALLFELENTMFGARRAMFDAMKKIAGERDMELTAALFCRFCVGARPEKFIPELLKHSGKKLSAEKMAKDFEKEYMEILTAKTRPSKNQVPELVSEALDKGLPCVAISFLNQGAAEHLARKAGLEGRIGIHCVYESAGAEPNYWLAAARGLEVSPLKCVAIASESRSCISAIAAEMWCVVKPDEFTEFQDFGGADVILDEHAKVSLDKLRPCTTHGKA